MCRLPLYRLIPGLIPVIISCVSVPENSKQSPLPTASFPTADQQKDQQEDQQEMQARLLENLTIRVDAAILNGDFNEWKGYLSRNYLNAFSRPEIILQINQTPKMQNTGLKIGNLEDFFRFVVIPSRKNIEWIDIEFSDAKHAIIYSVLDGIKVTVYEFILYDNEWKLNLPHIS